MQKNKNVPKIFIQYMFYNKCKEFTKKQYCFVIKMKFKNSTNSILPISQHQIIRMEFSSIFSILWKYEDLQLYHSKMRRYNEVQSISKASFFRIQFHVEAFFAEYNYVACKEERQKQYHYCKRRGRFSGAAYNRLPFW